MAMPEPYADLAEVIADGNPFDWDDAELRAATDEDRATVLAFRRLAVVGHLFATASSSLGAAAERERAILQPGTRWGSLLIRAHIGRGRFGDVYRAWDGALDREVALKLIDDAGPGAGAASELIHEGQLMARVRHPNVVAIHGAQRIDGVTGLTMELVDGSTLEDELGRRGTFGADEILDTGIQICRALTAVHASGLVHRDVKASNILRDAASGRLMLGDFGTGRRLEDDAGPHSLAGTPAYLAPEVFAGQAATPRSDLYSVGVLLHRLATGEYPLSGRSIGALRDAHARGERARLSTRQTSLPSPLVAVIDRALEADPVLRFASPDAMAHSLERCRPGAGLSRFAWVGIPAAVVIATVAVWQMQTREPDITQEPPALRTESSSQATVQLPAPPAAVPDTSSGSSVVEPASAPRAPVLPDGPLLTGPTLVHPNPTLQGRMVFRGAAFNRRVIACGNMNVAICDVTSGSVQVLRPQTSAESFAPAGRSMLLSPDGTRVAYQWLYGPIDPKQVATVNVINADRTDDRELHRVLGSRGLLLHRWLADGSAVLVSELADDGRQAFLLPVDGGTRIDVWRLGRGLGMFFDLSPDRRYLAVSREVALGVPGLAVIDLSSGRDAMVAAEPQGVGYPLWTPDGQAVVFISTLEGGSTLKRVPVAQGKSAGPIEVVWRFGRPEVRPVAFGADGSLYASTQPGPSTVYVADVDLPRSLAKAPRLVDPADAEDTIGADWSPDGGHIAYLRGAVGRTTGTLGTVVIRTTGGGIVAEIPLPNALPALSPQVRWSPDGRRLAVSYSDGTPRGMAIDVIEVSSRERRPVVSGGAFDFPRWDSTGNWLYYRQSSSIIRHHLTTNSTEVAYQVQGFGIQRFGGGFDLSPTDGALAILATQLKVPGCVIRIAEASGALADRHVFRDDCVAIAWSRDGSRILVSTLGGAAASLWALHRRGGDPVRLPIEGSLFYGLSVSPDGTRLLYSVGNPQWSMVMLAGMFGARLP